MAYEVELKFKVADPSTLIERLIFMGALVKGKSDHADLYLAHPSRDFKQTDEALRLRRIGSENRITYKGPKRGGPTKTREEIELVFEPGPDRFEQLSTLFERLGFQSVALIRKTREEFEVSDLGRPVSVLLDDAANLGQFAEIEALADDEADLSEAQAAVLRLAEHLGLHDVEPRSYLRMTLERLSQE
jgi:adenylate cyclase class 2